jgi:alpha-ribazole phosphatase/probable phosphoglycerate mutase
MKRVVWARQLGERVGCSVVGGVRVIEIVFETHSLSEDNEAGRATGGLDGRLPAGGRQLAAELGVRRRNDGIVAVFASDLGRARETAAIAFNGSGIPVLLDWRLRECDYGVLNGGPAREMHATRREHIDEPSPGGESWRQAVARVGRMLDDLLPRWEGARVLLIGHVATRWALDCCLLGRSLEDLVFDDFGWREGWEYRLGTSASGTR